MGDMLTMVQAARDPTREYLANYYHAQGLSVDREKRAQQLQEQALRMTLDRLRFDRQQRLDEEAGQQKEQEAFLGVAKDLGEMAATEAKATGKLPDENWWAGTYADLALKRGVSLAKYPTPGPYGQHAKMTAQLALADSQAKKDEPSKTAGPWPMGDQEAPAQWNNETKQWEPVKGFGGPRYKPTSAGMGFSPGGCSWTPKGTQLPCVGTGEPAPMSQPRSAVTPNRLSPPVPREGITP